MHNRCPECGSNKLRTTQHNGEIVCSYCGLVLEESSFEPEPFLSEHDKNTATIPQLAMAGTQIGPGRIIRKAWLYSTREKSLHAAKKNLELIASRHKLPEYVVQEALVLFKQSVEISLNSGRDNESILYGCIYAACNIHSIPKTVTELALHSGITRTRLLRIYKLIKSKLNLRVTCCEPIDFIPKYGISLGLQQNTIALAADIILKLKGHAKVAGKNPQTIVAAALYAASVLNNERIPQRYFTNTTGVIEVTIRRRSREILGIIAQEKVVNLYNIPS